MTAKNEPQSFSGGGLCKEAKMPKTINLVYLVVYVCVSLIQYAHLPTVNQFPYAYLWAIAPFLYPFCHALARSRIGFGKGLLMILLISIIAQVFEIMAYLLKTGGFQHRDSDTVVLLGFYLIGPLGACLSNGSGHTQWA